MNTPSDLVEVSYTYWLLVFGLSLCASMGYVVRLAVRTDRSRLRNRMTAAVAVMALCLFAVGGMNFLHRNLESTYRLSGTVAVVSLTASLTWLHLKHSKTSCDRFIRRVSAWFLLVSSVTMTALSSYQFQSYVSLPSRRPALVVTTPGKRSQTHEFVAMTDRKHPLKVYRLDEIDSDSENGDFPGDRYGVEYTGSYIQRAAASPLANCHGWVFLDGQYLISDEAVQRILDDNGYEVVDEAMAGDVIIYRDDDRNIVHSGVVRGVLNDGTIIIESKWGTEGVFLHNPMDTPYTATFEYYRTMRSTHRVNIVPVDELPIDD